MTVIMKNKAAVAAVVAMLISGGNNIRAQSLTQAQAQSLVAQIQLLQSADDLSVMLQAVEMTTPASASLLPEYGTFWSSQHAPGSDSEWPPLPANINQLPVWNLGGDAYILDDTNFVYDVPIIAPHMANSKSGGIGMMTMNASIPPFPGGGGTNSGGVSPQGVSAPVNYSTNLWIAQFNLATNNLTGIASNTLAGVTYELQTNSSLTTTDWSTMGYILGSELTNWTPLNAVSAGLTNNLFFRLRSDFSSDGSGLPDWWEQQYGITNADPNAQDSAGDGWTVYQKFQMGLNPNVFYTPPAPEGLTANYNASSNTVVLNWFPSPGPVTGYTVTDSAGNTFQVPAGTNYFQNFVAPTVDSYSVTADYYLGNSEPSSVSLGQSPDFTFVNGANGYVNLVLYNPPADLSSVKITRISQQDTGGTINYWPNVGSSANYPTDLVDGAFFIPTVSFTNGIAAIPASQMFDFGYYDLTVQLMRSNGLSSAASAAYDGFVNNSVFVDGRAQLKDNLRFLLRAASDNGPFEVFQSIEPTNYVYSGFFNYNNFNDAFWPLMPFWENNYLRNFVFDATNLLETNNITYGAFGPVTSAYIGMPNTGVYFEYPYDTITDQYGDSYFVHTDVGLAAVPQRQADFSGFIKTNVLPSAPTSALAGTLSQWILPDYDIVASGGAYYGNQNFYGLSQTQMSVVYSNNQFIDTLQAAGDPPAGSPATLYLNSAQPIFHTDSYYFGRPGIDPLPDQGYNVRPSPFSPTDSTPILLSGVGNPVTVAGYAKLTITNGYPGVYGYLGQYFTNAYEIGTNGTATANTTGILSPYGNFFATQPGPAALVTMPDVDPPYEQGTCTVYAVSLQLDKNHDGTMDTTFNGPDTTSLSSPDLVWVNNGHIVPATNGAADTDIQIQDGVLPNYSYGQITCQRDLENFFRLWICGVPSLPLYQNYTFTLSMTPLSQGDNPAINIYSSCETNGGTGYLTDTNIALQQTDTSTPGGFGMSLGTVSNNCPCTIPSIAFISGGTQYFLFEGAGIGRGQLTLTISQNSTVICQTSVYLDLHDVQNFFERPEASDVSLADPPTTNTGAYKIDSYETAQVSSETNEIIVFVHGANNSQFVYDDSNETMFKRLYWQGYEGRYVAFRWPSPTWSIFPMSTNEVSYFDYNQVEYIGWQSGAALKNYINALRIRFPDYAMNVIATSGGGVVANEAIRLGAQVDNFAMLVVTLPAEAFDGNNPSLIYDYLAIGGANTPDADALGGYNNCFTNGTRRVNFYNDDDFACYTSVFGNWETIQKTERPDHSSIVPGWFYDFDGTNCLYYTTGLSGEITSTRMLTQDFEKKSFVAKSRTKAIGAAGLKYPPNALAGGVISTNVSLQDPNLGFVGGAAFGATRAEHSGAFTKPIQTAMPFYRALLDTGFDIRPEL